MHLWVVLLVVMFSWSSVPAAEAGMKGHAISLEFVRETAEYLQNSSNSIPVPTSAQESEYLSLAMTSARSAADRALTKEVEAGKLASAKADREVEAASAEADRRNVFKAVSLATAGFIAGSLIVSRTGYSFDNIASGIQEVARVLREFVNMLEGHSLLSFIFSPFRRKKISDEGEGNIASDAPPDTGLPSGSKLPSSVASDARSKVARKRLFKVLI